jgi:hypothetical protein
VTEPGAPTPTADDRRLLATLLRQVGVEPSELDTFIKTPEVHRPALGLSAVPPSPPPTPSLWDRARDFLRAHRPAEDDDTLEPRRPAPAAKKPTTLGELGQTMPPLAELHAEYPTAKDLLATAQTSDDIVKFLQSYTPADIRRTWPDLTVHFLQQKQYGLSSWTLRSLGWV